VIVQIDGVVGQAHGLEDGPYAGAGLDGRQGVLIPPAPITQDPSSFRAIPRRFYSLRIVMPQRI
jgi:hypothetical protein